MPVLGPSASGELQIGAPVLLPVQRDRGLTQRARPLTILSRVEFRVTIVIDVLISVRQMNVAVMFAVRMLIDVRLSVFLQPLPPPSGPTDYGTPASITVGVGT